MSITETPPSARSRGWTRLVRGAVDLALPASCLACGRAGEGGGHLGLCLACRGRLKRPAPGCGRCGEAIPAAAVGGLPRPTESRLCGGCRRDPPPFVALVVPWSYRGPIAAVVRALKFGRLEYLGAHLSQDLAAEIARAVALDDGRGWDAVVPVPLHWRRRWVRGYNQAERIARPLARRLGLPFVEALRRRRATPPQTGLDRKRRLESPRRAFAPRRRRGGRPRSGRAILVDDVATTGATLRAAAHALRGAGFEEVLAVAAARTPDEPAW